MRKCASTCMESPEFSPWRNNSETTLIGFVEPNGPNRIVNNAWKTYPPQEHLPREQEPCKCEIVSSNQAAGRIRLPATQEASPCGKRRQSLAVSPHRVWDTLHGEPALARNYRTAFDAFMLWDTSAELGMKALFSAVNGCERLTPTSIINNGS